MAHRTLVLACFVAVTLAISTSSNAVTLTVRQDGSGQYLTINAAKNAASANDIIEVGPGTYTEEIDISIPLSLISTDGPSATSLDGETIRRIVIFRSGENRLEGFTLKRGYHASAGGALRVQGPLTHVAVNDCIFEENVSDFDGAAFIARDSGTIVDFTDCAFINNHAARHSAALMVLNGSANFYHCRFEGNTGETSGAIAKASGAGAIIVDCLFLNNGGGNTIWMSDGFSRVKNNTFHNNTGSSIYLADEYAEVERNIFSEAYGGFGIYYYISVTGYRSCNVFWNNSLGAVNDPPQSDDAVIDPLFCDPENDDFTISSNSAASPTYSSCAALVGAFPVACNIGEPPPPPPVIAPVIISIDDVPNDQGRQVRIRWDRARYDALNQPYVITGYAVYRRQNDPLSPQAVPSLAAERGDRTPHIDGWDYIATVPARGDDIYQYVAPTLCDQPKNKPPCWSVFLVSAMTPNPLVYFDSAPDSGYSTDNLPPGPPSALVVHAAPGGNALLWEPSESPDVVLYQVYRAVGQAPEPTSAFLVQSTSATEWMDADPGQGAAYAVVAVDRNGNESEAVSQDPNTGVGDRIPATMYLAQNAPNPFNPSTSIEFGVPASGGLVTLDVFDVAGRRIRALLNEQRAAGVWRVTWDGRTDAGTRVSSGVYFYRLRVGSGEQTRRMTLLE